MRKSAIVFFTIILLMNMMSCSKDNTTEVKGTDQNNTATQFTETLPESVMQRVADAIAKGETNIEDFVDEKTFELSSLSVGNMIPTYTLENNKFVKGPYSFIPFFYNNEPIFCVTTSPKTEYVFSGFMEKLRGSGFTKATIVYDKDSAYFFNGEKAIKLWDIGMFTGRTDTLLDQDGKITVDCSGLVYCDLTQIHPLTPSK